MMMIGFKERTYCFRKDQEKDHWCGVVILSGWGWKQPPGLPLYARPHSLNYFQRVFAVWEHGWWSLQQCQLALQGSLQPCDLGTHTWDHMCSYPSLGNRAERGSASPGEFCSVDLWSRTCLSLDVWRFTLWKQGKERGCRKEKEANILWGSITRCCCRWKQYQDGLVFWKASKGQRCHGITWPSAKRFCLQNT